MLAAIFQAHTLFQIEKQIRRFNEKSNSEEFIDLVTRAIVFSHKALLYLLGIIHINDEKFN
jgi:hypothetical protein